MDKIITKNQVIDTLGTKLSEEFSVFGFKYIKSKKYLIRKNKKGFDRITFNTYDSYPISHQELSIGFQKRINVVEEIVNQFFDKRFKNPEFDKFSITVYSDYKLLREFYSFGFKSDNINSCELCTQVKNLKGDNFILHTEGDIENIGNYLITFIRDKILPFFEINNDLHHVNKNYKKQILETFNANGWIEPLLFMRSLVLMKLTKDPEFNIIKEKYIKCMVIPGNPAALKLEVEAVKELIDYLQ